MRHFRAQSWQQQRLQGLHLDNLSREARTRLKWIEWHQKNGQNVSLTSRRFGISRSTLYRWLKRYQPYKLRSLEDRSCRPKKVRQRTWTSEEVLAVKKLRERYPAWGKMKLCLLLALEGVRLSASKAGRILSYLKRRGELKEPLRRSLRRRRRGKRPYAMRKPKHYRALEPGDIVQLDTMDVRPEPGVVLKQFTAVDVVSRWSVPTLASAASATLAKRALEELLERTPYPIKAVQVDGGSEFMAEFEEACQEKGIRLFVLPPRSPKLNGAVERANRTYREEFYECSDAPPTVRGLRPALRRYEHIYNFIRPHQALGYLTPAQSLQEWATKKQQEVSRTC
jgi:transposase InsO family protein